MIRTIHEEIYLNYTAFAVLYFLCMGLVSFGEISLTKLETCFMRLPLLPLSAVASIWFWSQKFHALEPLPLSALSLLSLFSWELNTVLVPSFLELSVASSRWVASLGKYKDQTKNSFLSFSLPLAQLVQSSFMWIAPKAYMATLLARGKSQEYIDLYHGCAKSWNHPSICCKCSHRSPCGCLDWTSLK